MRYFNDFFNNFSQSFDTFCEKYLTRIAISIIVILIFLALKFIITAIAKRIIRKVCSKSDQTEERIKAINSIVLPPIRIILISVAFAISYNIISPPDSIRAVCQKTFTSLIITALFSVLYGFCGYLKFILQKLYNKEGDRPHTLASNYIGIILKTVVVIFGAITVLQQWISNITSLLAGLSIGGVAIALAAQDTAENFFGALTVIFDRPFEIGDFIEVSSVSGTVEKMGLRSTKIRRNDQALVVLPNSKISSDHIVNWTTISKRRVDLTLGILYSTPLPSIQKFKLGIENILKNTENVENDTFLVTFNEFADSSLNIGVRFYVLSPKYDEMCRVRDGVNLDILKLASDINIDFAYPSRSIYIENIPTNIQEKI